MFSEMRHRDQRRGQALAEFAIVIPVFMLVLGGVIQFGIFFWDQNTLNQIARDAGRYAATVECTGSETTIESNIEDATRTLEAATPFAGSYGTVSADVGASDSTVGCPPGPSTNADVVWVSISVEATVPIFFPLVSGNISSTATYRMEPYAG